MNRSTRLFRYSLVALAATAMVACGGNDNPSPAPAPAPAPTPTPTPSVSPDTYVLTSGNKLVGFAAADPSKTNVVTVAVPATETLLGGDFRPSDAAFYIVTKVTADNAVKVYTVNVTTGALGAAIPLLNNGMGAGGGTAAAPVTLTGAKVGVDFNPVANALRIIDSNGVNLRTTLAAGNNTFVDAPISTGLADAGYTNTFSASCETNLYYINGTQFFITPAPNGLLSNAATPRLVGSFGVTADLDSGLDVRTTGSGNTFTAALKVGGSYGLYELAQSTGIATSKGAIGGLGSERVLSLVANLPATAPATGMGGMVAITGGSTPSLVTFNRPPQGSPNKLCSSAAITGLMAGDVIVGADARASTAPGGNGTFTLLAKNGTAGRLYTLNPSSAAATSVAVLVNATGGAAIALSGASYGVDFNPVPDRLRVVGDDGQNLRIDVSNGMTTVDTALTTAGGTTARAGVSAVSYTNSIAGGNGASMTTTLFGLDSTANSVVRIGADPANGTAGDAGNPNSGVVNNIANLVAANPDGSASTTAIDIGAVNAFEILGDTGLALMAAAPGTATNATLYTVNLATGAAARVQDFASPIVAMSTNGIRTATVFGVTNTGNKLVSFLPNAPGTVTAIGGITVPAGETVLGIDFRPSIGGRNNQLVALTSAGKLYEVSPGTAAATLLSSLSGTGVMVAATDEHGIDFNPVPDRLRTISVNGNNLRSAVETGTTTSDTVTSQLGIFGAGYSNNFTATTSTTLYVLRSNAAADELARVGAMPATGGACPADMGNPNCGVVTSIGALGVDTSTLGDIDIAGGHNGFPLAALQLTAGGVSGLYRINLATGSAGTKIADIATAGSEPLRAMAIRLQ